MPSNAAISYSDEAYHTSGPRLMGAQSASEGFLRAYVRYSGVDELCCYANAEPHYQSFVERMRALGGEQPCRWVSPLEIEELASIGTIYFPDPTVQDATWHRRRAGAAAFSVCGVTHTTCSDNFMDLVGKWAITPLEPWDAIICTSQSVLQTVTFVLDTWEEYLRERLGATRLVRPQLPVIPLGVDVERLPDDAQRASMRRAQRALLGIEADDIAFLFFGRLSFHAKAHPLPMFLALESAARRTGKQLHLILAGWFANQHIEQAFLRGARTYAPSVKVRVVDGRRADIREQVWYAADIFTSLSDNIQETFGLTPIEAMAAGLPVVISDWDGYRDTVEHGVQGFLVPTTMPPPGAGEEMSRRFATRADTYDRYIAHQSQCTAVDIAACAAFYVQLIEQPQLRQQLGAAGRQRARDVFSWRGVIDAYQQLWDELAARRAQAKGSPAAAPASPWHPLRQDPLRVFAGYATHHLTGDVVLRLATPQAARLVPGLYADPLVNYAGAPFVLGTLDECQQLVSALGQGERTVDELLAPFSPERSATIVRTLGWLLKCGMIQR